MHKHTYIHICEHKRCTPSVHNVYGQLAESRVCAWEWRTSIHSPRIYSALWSPRTKPPHIFTIYNSTYPHMCVHARIVFQLSFSACVHIRCVRATADEAKVDTLFPHNYIYVRRAEPVNIAPRDAMRAYLFLSLRCAFAIIQFTQCGCDEYIHHHHKGVFTHCVIM